MQNRRSSAPKGLSAGAQLLSGAEAPIKAGNTLPLRSIPVGTTVHCIEMLPGKGAQLARAAGTSVQLLAREGDYAQLRMIVDSALVTLKSSLFSNGTDTVTLKVPSGPQTGIKVEFGGPVHIAPGQTDLVVDFDVSRSFVFQGPATGPYGASLDGTTTHPASSSEPYR